MRNHDGHRLPSRGVVVLAIRSESSIIIQSIATCLTRGKTPYLRRHRTLSNQRIGMFDSEHMGSIRFIHLPDEEGKVRAAT